jgi:hypothetical protein
MVLIMIIPGTSPLKPLCTDKDHTGSVSGRSTTTATSTPKIDVSSRRKPEFGYDVGDDLSGAAQR